MKFKVAIEVEVEAEPGDFSGALGKAQDAIAAARFSTAKIESAEPFVIKFGDAPEQTVEIEGVDG